jgi:2-polyprenyl-6-hydroxyphenyl methylase/3-demethylubiquinone-9 3-methyltransferase
VTGERAFYESYWAGGASSPPEHDPLTERRWQELARRVRPGDRVLDFGCGGGIFSKKLTDAGCEVVGIDVAEQALEIARKRAPTARFIRLDPGGQLPIEGVDCVWATEVLEHVQDPGYLLEDFARVLAPGGKLLVTVPYHGVLKNLVIALARFDRHFNPRGAHIRFFTRKSLEKLAGEAGFRPQAFAGLGRLPYLWKSMFLCFESIE